MKKISTLLTILFAVVSLTAQSSQDFWKDINTTSAFTDVTAKAYLPADDVRALGLDYAAMQSYLKAAPMEFTAEAEQSPLLLEIPMPDGSMSSFGVYEISIMEPGLSAQFPTIKTYAGNNLNNPDVFVRITTGPLGYHSTIFHGDHADVIESVAVGQTEKYVSYNLDNTTDAGTVTCGNHDEIEEKEVIVPMSMDQEVNFSEKSVVPVDLRTYRMAVATTAEYSQQNGNNPASVLNSVTSVINQVNGIFEKDNAIRLELIANTSDVFFFPPVNDDPYENGDASNMITVNPIVLNNAFGLDGYDIGHVFGRALGAGVVGLGALASVCTMQKGRGVSNVLGPNFYKTVVHEVGHQFNATHTFNNCDAENEFPGTGYEPGGGSTIMAYAGACTTNSVQGDADDYFHINSLERIKAYSTGISGGSCANVIATSNNTPEVTIPIDGGFVIPINTPFELTGEATDPDGDDLTYTWEQYDLGPASPLGSPSENGTPPLFRSYPPNSSLTRVFPRIQTIVNNSAQSTEVLPFTTRDLTFRFTARDCNPEAGGYGYAEIAFSSNENAGPFLVTAPNSSADSWEVGKYVEVTWDVANTDGPQVDCQFVDIYLSRDGGITYPITLLENTKNDGSEFVVVPDEVTINARVKVKAHDNIFFDISNNNFTIVAPTAPDFSVSSYGPACAEVCVPNTFDVTLETGAILGFSEMITFSAPNLPTGATVSFSTNPVTPGESTTASFDFSDAVMDGDATITIVAEATGADAEERVVQLNLVNSDFSMLTLDAPKGSANSTLPDYSWSDLPNGLTYSIEVATDAAFTNIIDTDNGLEEATYQSSVALEEGTVYYWRIAVSNECGTGEFGEIAAFKTIEQACNITPVPGPIVIPSANGSVVQSTVNLIVGGEISDVNVRNIDGIYNAFGDIVFRLKGPGSNTVQLMNQEPCSSPGAFNFGFDNQAVLMDIPCPPPATGSNYQPVEELGIFNGLDAAGDWTLEVEVVTNFGAGGTIDSWDLEICGTAAPNDPEVGLNDLICAHPGETNPVLSDYLEITDSDNTPAEITMTIVQNTQYGDLALNGTTLNVNESFTMADIYSSAVTYSNTDGSQTADQFSFVAEDPSGGFVGVIIAHIEINPDCVVSSREAIIENDVLAIYPNPATDLLNVEMIEDGKYMNQVSVFNGQGQLVLDRQIDQVLNKTQLSIGHLPTGVYLVQVRTDEGIAAKKVFVE